MDRTKKARLKKLTNRITRQLASVRQVRVYADEDGCWWDRDPDRPGAVQLTPKEVADLRADPDAIVFVIVRG